MAGVPSVRSVETEDDYVHVRFRDPDQFATIRTPDWAEQPAHAVSPGSQVRMGNVAGKDEWEVQSVLIDASIDEQTAEQQAIEIVEKIES